MNCIYRGEEFYSAIDFVREYRRKTFRSKQMKSYMIGLGTIINSTAIVAGGLIGHFTGKLFRQDQQDAVILANEILFRFGRFHRGICG